MLPCSTSHAIMALLCFSVVLETLNSIYLDAISIAISIDSCFDLRVGDDQVIGVLLDATDEWGFADPRDVSWPLKMMSCPTLSLRGGARINFQMGKPTPRHEDS